MAKYNDLSVLRGKLTTEDPDVRAKAYQAVLEADVQPSSVLDQDPPKKPLIKNGVIPENVESGGPPASTLREKQVDLLTEIRDILKSNDGGTQ